MGITRRDDWLTTPQGQALPGALVYFLNQPADTSTNPPTPLATVYKDLAGTPGDNPQTSDGYGHTVAYLNNGQVYTIAFYHPMLGALAPLVLEDQSLNSSTSTGGNLFGEVPAGVIDGTNRVFTLSRAPLPNSETAYLNIALVPGYGYTISGTTLTYARAPQPAAGGISADVIYLKGSY